jgi:prophage DNA circulation protein
LPDPTPASLGTQGTSLAIDQSDASWLDSSWWEQLQPGSWRGVGFVMDTAETRAGRRTSTHEYPYRDTVWVEDLGRLPRRFSVTAYLTGDDVYQQRNAMIQACEQAGEGTLVHPTLGSVQCVLIDFATTDRRERGRFVEIALSFVVSGDILFPTSAQATGSLVNTAADALNTASAGDLASSLADLQRVPQIATQAIAQFGNLAITAVNDPLRALNAVVGLQGFYGRYSAGSLGTLQPPTATVASALTQSIVSRETVLSAVADLNAAAGAL